MRVINYCIVLYCRVRGGVSLPAPAREESGEGIDSSSGIFLLFDLKMEHFGAVFKLDLTEETRTE